MGVMWVTGCGYGPGFDRHGAQTVVGDGATRFLIAYGPLALGETVCRAPWAQGVTLI